MKVSKVYDWIKVSFLSQGKWIILLHSVIFEMHIFSCLEAGSFAVCLQVTAKLWHAALFLLENVPSDNPEFGGNIQGAQILLSEVLGFFFLLPFYLKGAEFCRVILIVGRIMPFSGVYMKWLIPIDSFLLCLLWASRLIVWRTRS